MFDGPMILWAAFFACVLDAICGYPQALFCRIGHPVSWIGALIAWLEARLNVPVLSSRQKRQRGVSCLIMIASLPGFLAICMQWFVQNNLPHAVQTLCLGAMAAPFFAQNSLRRHVAHVARALTRQGLSAGRSSVSHIVGRDVRFLDEGGVARAAIESLAENFSDGVVAPLFWFLVAGFPGLVIYKCVNTADSMIGHLNARYADFGRAAALTDDVVNAVPARLTALLIAVGGGGWSAFKRAIHVAWRDGPHHRSFNAGWPEGAMAGALNVSLAGPRCYDRVLTEDKFLNASGRDATAQDISRALRLYSRASLLIFIIIGLLCALAAG